MAKRSLPILKIDPQLAPYAADLHLRDTLFAKAKDAIGDLVAFADAHWYFGFHRTETGWVYREWAPAADALYLTGDFNNWDTAACPLTRLPNGVFEAYVDELQVGQKVQAIVWHNGQMLRRIPLYATRVVQDPQTFLWCAELEDTFAPFPWTDAGFVPPKTPFIYECHIGMAQEAGTVGQYREFTEHILPRIHKAGYNTIQIMAVMEHPYYGSFGYQVSNFFAASSRYGTSAELKALIDKAHEYGIAVLLDVVHSHAAKNTNEGLGEFDGTAYQFFHEGARGNHTAWDTKLFNYGKHDVLRFLLSNLRYWMEVFHFDGFRFDGVTSMLYHNHGLNCAFSDYAGYFSLNTDVEAVTYLQLANELIHTLNPRAITIAEDMSGMPGMCLPIKKGGIGFDYRLAMGVPDLWIRLLKEVPDEHWHLGTLWYELTNRRPQEKTIGYCESHDQALVGDKTIMFRLCDAEMYTKMQKFAESLVIDRGIALHKLIRLLTASLGGEGYLNFMGNEFGHPEWIDFPREGNGWSHHYCRRQWSLVDNPDLRYRELGDFDRAMLALLKREKVLSKAAECLKIHEDDKVIVYRKGALVFAFNFHPETSFDSYPLPVGDGQYRVVLSSDDGEFGGFDRVDTAMRYTAENGAFRCYLPNRSVIVFKKQ